MMISQQTPDLLENGPLPDITFFRNARYVAYLDTILNGSRQLIVALQPTIETFCQRGCSFVQTGFSELLQ